MKFRQKSNCLYIIEKDFNLAKKLKEKYSEIKKIKVFNNDILDFEIEKVLPDNSIIFEIFLQYFITNFSQNYKIYKMAS